MSKSSKSKKAQSQPHAAPSTVEATLPGAAPRWALGAILAAYIVLTSLLIIFVPINAAPDEAAHVQYVQHLALRGQFPVFVPNGAPTPGYEFHQPPLYYALCVPLWHMTGVGVQFYMCRVVSLMCGALTLVLLWHAVVALFPRDPQLPVIATGFAALWPLHQGVGASASNGALACLICAAIYYGMARAATREWKLTDSILLGALVGCGLLTATSTLIMLFIAAGAAWHFVARDRRQEQVGLSPVYAMATVVGIAMLVGGWWLARNQKLYGDPLAMGIFNQAFSKTSPGPAAFFAEGIAVKTYLYAECSILFCAFWGLFGGPNTAIDMLFSGRNPFVPFNVRPGTWPALGLGAICALATLIAAVGLLRFLRNRDAQSNATCMALVWWSLGFALVGLSFLQFQMHYFQAQARYFHPALLPMALAFALGWKYALGNSGQGRVLWLASGLFAATLVGLTLWNVLGWRTLV